MNTAPTAVPLTPQQVRAFADQAGIHAIGWFAASDFPAYLEAFRRRTAYHRIAYRPAAAFEKAGHIPEGTRTVVVLVMDYYIEPNDSTGAFRLSNYVRACWNTVNPKVRRLADFLKGRGYRADALDVPQRAAACRAGLGFIGRNAMFYAHGMGSYVGIVCLGTDAVFEGAAESPEQVVHPRCRDCGRCVTACPVGAIDAGGYAIDPLRCVSMLNRHPDEPERIMPRAAASLDRWLYGCEACQDACPMNREAVHRAGVVVTPQIQFEGLTLPNVAGTGRDVLEAARGQVASPGFRDYLERLLNC